MTGVDIRPRHPKAAVLYRASIDPLTNALPMARNLAGKAMS